MKKYLFLFTAACSLIMYSSCKKSYTCECTNSWTNEKFNTDIKASKRSNAEQHCIDMNAPEVDGPRDCHLVD